MDRLTLVLIACGSLALGMVMLTATIGASGYLTASHVQRTSFLGANHLPRALSDSAGGRVVPLNVSGLAVCPFPLAAQAFALTS